MQDLFTQVNIRRSILQFLQECDFYNKLKIFTLYIFYIFILKFYVRRIGR